jgi:hypothetical protein
LVQVICDNRVRHSFFFMGNNSFLVFKQGFLCHSTNYKNGTNLASKKMENMLSFALCWK